jgi:CubicO group peptidase (beta-lactamase class C family)
VAGPGAALEHAEAAEIGRFPVQPGVSLDEYVASGPVSGMVVVWRGRVAFERYPRMQPGQRHLMMSVTKAVTSVVAGILELRGALDLRQPVDALIGELAGSGWAGVRGTDVLFVAALPSHRPAGEAYEYTGANTFVLSWLIERAIGRPFAEVLGREIWQRAGFEAPAQLCVSADGAPASHGGLSVTLRDLARLGMLFTPSARLVSGHPVISAEHLRRIQGGARPELHRDRGPLPGYMTEAYGPVLPPASRQWDFAMADGDLFKGGFGGQGLYLSPARDLVIAFAGTPEADGSDSLLRWFSRRLAVALG